MMVMMIFFIFTIVRIGSLMMMIVMIATGDAASGSGGSGDRYFKVSLRHFESGLSQCLRGKVFGQNGGAGKGEGD